MKIMALNTENYTLNFCKMLNALFNRLGWNFFETYNNSDIMIIEVPEEDLFIWEEMGESGFLV